MARNFLNFRTSYWDVFFMRPFMHDDPVIGPHKRCSQGRPCCPIDRAGSPLLLSDHCEARQHKIEIIGRSSEEDKKKKKTPRSGRVMMGIFTSWIFPFASGVGLSRIVALMLRVGRRSRLYRSVDAV